MKKVLITLAAVAMLATSATAQKSTFTINSRAWSTNYWTTILYGLAQGTVVTLIGSNNHADSIALAAVLPDADLVFPVGIAKSGFNDDNIKNLSNSDIYGPYYDAFGIPFKKMGDFCIGLDASWTPSFIGLYAGVFFKSQELCFKHENQYLRSFYFQPRGGRVISFQDIAIEGGVFYDKVLGGVGNLDRVGADKTMFSDGLGLDFGLSHNFTSNSRTVFMFSMPLHNFLNEGYEGPTWDGSIGKPWEGVNRRVGYITITHRICL